MAGRYVLMNLLGKGGFSEVTVFSLCRAKRLLSPHFFDPRCIKRMIFV